MASIPTTLLDPVTEAMEAEDERTTVIDRWTARRALDAVPDGWAKVDGEWVQVETLTTEAFNDGIEFERRSR